MKTRVSRATKEVLISDDQPTVLIGERINPTGKKKLAAALLAGDMELVRSEAIAQVQAGADILDVNVGASGIDETRLLPQAVQAVMEAKMFAMLEYCVPPIYIFQCLLVIKILILILFSLLLLDAPKPVFQIVF